jgi:cellulose synthase/poly-beta-1,6-N-acetylglucosamine synthase-like glycosyltransferase
MMTFWSMAYWLSFAGLVYVLVGYWLVVLLIAAFVPRRSHAACAPTVSLIVPAHNEAAVLSAKLENSLSLDYPAEKLEIIVASDGSTDGTVEVARRFEQRGVKVLAFSPRRGKASVINDAVGAAAGEVLCLCDANVIFERDALRRLVQKLGDPRVGAATGQVRLASQQSNFGQGESFYYQLERRLQLAESAVGSLMGVDGGMYVLRKELFRTLPADTILDDFTISVRVMRQGYRIVYEPSAVAHENGTPAARQEWRRRVRVAAGAVQSLKRGCWPPLWQPLVLWQYLSHKALRWLAPGLLLLWLGANIVLAPTALFYLATLLGQLAVYAAAALAALFLPFRATRCGGICFYFVMSNIALAVGLVKGLLDLQPVTWVQASRQLGATE